MKQSTVMVALPSDLLSRLDREAERRSVSRDALLALAARREIDRANSEVADAVARSEERFRLAASFDAAALVRSDRDRQE